jgi:glutaredoxin
MPRVLRIKPACGAASLVLAGWLLALPAQAQYKIVAPDGSVTYTDRPPADARLNVTPLGRTPVGVATTGAPSAQPLPLELRQPAQRYPVTLYTAAECSACDTARQWLQQRGVPYSERLVITEADARALTELIGARTVPALTIGAQPLRGFAAQEWGAFIDAAGYPRENRLPRGWQPPPATPVGPEEPRPAATPAAPPAPATPSRPPSPAPAAPPPAPGGLRF